MRDPNVTDGSRFRAASLAALVVTAGAVAGLAFLTIVVLPKFRLIFAELFEGARLPACTGVLLSISPAAFAAAAVASLLLLIWKEIALRDKGVALSVNFAALALCGLAFVFIIVALFLPLVDIITNLRR